MDKTDARLLLALTNDPRATVAALAEGLGLSRNTVQARLARLDERQMVASFERRIEVKHIGYPLSAFITVVVVQQRLDAVAVSLSGIAEILNVLGLTGSIDLLVHVAARDADDLYRVAGQVLAIEGVERTETALVMRELVGYRATPLLRRTIGIDGSGD